MHSPSSINTYRQCPRKYYYRYIKKLPTTTNHYAIIGNSIHSILEKFFLVNLRGVDQTNFDKRFRVFIYDLMNEEFENAKKRLAQINYRGDLDQIHSDFDYMIDLWISNFNNRIQMQLDKGSTMFDAFRFLKPKTEMNLKCRDHNVQGYVDAIFERKNGDIIVDYKTGKRDILSEDYLIQLAIYALLYFQNYGKMPRKVGVEFLKHGKMVFLDVDDELLARAKLECELIEMNTKSKNMIDYPKKTSPLCKWNGGQCDFYETCFSTKTLNDF